MQLKLQINQSFPSKSKGKELVSRGIMSKELFLTETHGERFTVCALVTEICLYLSQVQGISMFNMETSECKLAVKLDDEPCVLTRFSTDVLFTNQKKSSIWQLSGNGKDRRGSYWSC